ncbi:hypothetical protein ACFWA9_17235 [Kitasatospora sp. NPDC059973]
MLYHRNDGAIGLHPGLAGTTGHSTAFQGGPSTVPANAGWGRNGIQLP